MRPFTYHRHAERIDLFADRLGDLIGHPFLDLEPPRKDVDQTRNLAETDDSFTRDVRDVALAEKGEEMMLTERVEIDVLDDHHLVVIDGEQCVVEDIVDV